MVEQKVSFDEFITNTCKSKGASTTLVINEKCGPNKKYIEIPRYGNVISNLNLKFYKVNKNDIFGDEQPVDVNEVSFCVGPTGIPIPKSDDNTYSFLNHDPVYMNALGFHIVRVKVETEDECMIRLKVDLTTVDQKTDPFYSAIKFDDINSYTTEHRSKLTDELDLVYKDGTGGFKPKVKSYFDTLKGWII